MTAEVQPASDEDIAYMKEVGEQYPQDIVSRYQTLDLIARIEQDRRRLEAAEKLAEALKRGMVNAEAPHNTSCPAQDSVCTCWVADARAALAEWEKAK